MRNTKYTVLGYLTLHGDRPVRAIASDLEMDTKTVRRWIDVLTEEGAIKVNDLEPRSRKITPTPAGQVSLFGEAETTSRQTPNSKPTDAFLQWWKVYPVKRNRAKAWIVWRQMKLDTSCDALMQALEYQLQVSTDKRNAGEFVPSFPYAVKYLKEKRWHDEV